MLNDGNNYIWRQKPEARQFTASQARDKTLLNQYVHSDKAYSFIKNPWLSTILPTHIL